jgi:hypothetical protein
MLSLAEVISKSLFFLGAGFSFGTGCKTSIEMFDDLRKRIFDEQDETFNQTQKEALKFLIACLQYHSEWRTMESNGITFKPNIEELALLIRRIKNRENFLPYPITGNWADKLVTLESQYFTESKNISLSPGDGLFESLEKIFKNLLRDEWFKINCDLSFMNPLLELIKSTPNEEYRFDIFTLNNDLVIEEYFSSHYEIPWRGFVEGKWQGIDKDEMNDPFGRINLFKLHGSIDWVRLEDMDVWEEPKLDDKKRENIEEKHNPYLIFGQGTKTFSVEPFFSLINYFYKQLNSGFKEYFFIIGYSFFDPYINNLLFNAVKNLKKLIIVNPYFGPEKIYGGNKEILNDPDDCYRIKYPDGANQSDLTDYLREIQKNSFFSELPEFNYLTVSAENIEFIPLKTEEFIKYFFGDNGRLLCEFIGNFEKQKEESKPF